MRLRPGRIVVITIAMSAIAASTLWLSQRVSIAVGPSSQQPPPGLDISSYANRSAFLRYFRTAPPWSTSLIEHCGEGSGEIYRVDALGSPDAFSMHFVEVRSTGDSASVRRYFFPPPPPPPKSPQHGTRNPLLAEGYGIGASSESSTFDAVALPLVAFEEIRGKAMQLQRDEVPLVGGELAIDGTAMVLEMCRNGLYGFYSRDNPVASDPDDMRVVEVGNLILAAGKYPPFEAGLRITP